MSQQRDIHEEKYNEALMQPLEELSDDEQQAVLAAGNVMACAACSQEMTCDEENLLPLHMAEAKLCVGSYGIGEPPRFGTRIVEPLTIEDVGRLGVSEILASDICWSCGRPKAPGATLCKTDYGFLPFLIQKALPPFIKGYPFADEPKRTLFADEQPQIDGHFSKAQFMEVFKSALQALANIRGAAST